MRTVKVGGSYGSVPNRPKSVSNDNESSLRLIREEDRFKQDTPYQDKLFGVLFIVFLLLIFILSLFFFVTNESTYDKDSANSDNEYLNEHFWKLSIISISIAIGTTILLLFILAKYTFYLVWFSLILSFLLWLIYGIILIIEFKSISVGIIILFIALIQLLWIYLVRHRIEFATALIMLSIDALNKFKSTYFISIFGIFLQTFWLIIWLMGFSYSIDGTDATQITIFLYIFAYYWTFQVITNIVLCTICGTIGVWYFLFPQYVPNKPVYASFRRSITTSFGSICYGSLIIAVVQTIRLFITLLRSIVRDRNNNFCAQCILGCISCMLQCIEDIIEYINHYAFVRISIYGMNFCNSAKETLQLFRSRGFDLIINDDLTNSVLLLSCLLCSAFNGLCIGLISKYSYNNNSIETVVLWSFTAFAVSFALSMSSMVTIKAAVSTIFVSFAEGIFFCFFSLFIYIECYIYIYTDPAALSFTKPLKYEFLTNAWNKRYGSLPTKLTNPPRT